MTSLRWIRGAPLPLVDNLAVPASGDFMGGPRAADEPLDAISLRYAHLGRGFGAVAGFDEAGSIFKSKILGTKQPLIQARAREALRLWIKRNLSIGVDDADITVDRYSPARGVDYSLYGFIVWDADTATKRRISDKARDLAMMRGTRTLTINDFVPPGYPAESRGGFLVAFTDGETVFTPDVIDLISQGKLGVAHPHDASTAPSPDEPSIEPATDLPVVPVEDLGSMSVYSAPKRVVLRAARLDAKADRLEQKAMTAGLGGGEGAASDFANSMRSADVRMSLIAKVSQDGNKVTVGTRSGWAENTDNIAKVTWLADKAAKENGVDDPEITGDENTEWTFTFGERRGPRNPRLLRITGPRPTLAKLGDARRQANVGATAWERWTHTPEGQQAGKAKRQRAQRDRDEAEKRKRLALQRDRLWAGARARHEGFLDRRQANVGYIGPALNVLGNALTGVSAMITPQAPTPEADPKPQRRKVGGPVSVPSGKYATLVRRSSEADEYERKLEVLQAQYAMLRTALLKIDPKAAAIIDSADVSGFGHGSDSYAGLIEDVEDYVAITGDVDGAIREVGEILDALGDAYNVTVPPWIHVGAAGTNSKTTNPYGQANWGLDPQAQAMQDAANQRRKQAEKDARAQRKARERAENKARQTRKRLRKEADRAAQKAAEAERRAADAARRAADERARQSRVYKERLAEQKALAEEARLIAAEEHRAKLAEYEAKLAATSASPATTPTTTTTDEAEKPNRDDTVLALTKTFADTLKAVVAQPNRTPVTPEDSWLSEEDREIEALLREAEALADEDDNFAYDGGEFTTAGVYDHRDPEGNMAYDDPDYIVTAGVPPLGFVGYTNPQPRRFALPPNASGRIYLRPEGVGDLVPVATGPGTGMFGMTPDLRLRDVGGWRHTFRPHNNAVRTSFHGLQYPGFGF